MVYENVSFKMAILSSVLGGDSAHVNLELRVYWYRLGCCVDFSANVWKS